MKRILAIALLVAGGTAVWADGDEEGEGFARAPANATYEAECGACHLAYPAGFLPAASWSAIMATLPDHFGEDASLPPEQTTEIADYLQANAGRGPQGLDSANPPLRISELPWFVGEHGSKLVARAKADPKIGTMSDCIACHRGAAQGIFEDD